MKKEDIIIEDALIENYKLMCVLESALMNLDLDLTTLGVSLDNEIDTANESVRRIKSIIRTKLNQINNYD